MDLNTLATVVTTVAVVIGVGFGLVEIRRAARERRDRAAVEVVRSVQTQDIQRAVDIIMNLPDDADPDLVRGDAAVRDAAMLVYFACEMFGSFVYEEVVELHTLDRMVGGWVRSTWRRLRRWIEAERIENRNVNEGEWWQWLYERLEANPDPGKAIGAHVAYRGWRSGMRGRPISGGEATAAVGAAVDAAVGAAAVAPPRAPDGGPARQASSRPVARTRDRQGPRSRARRTETDAD